MDIASFFGPDSCFYILLNVSAFYASKFDEPWKTLINNENFFSILENFRINIIKFPGNLKVKLTGEKFSTRTFLFKIDFFRIANQNKLGNQLPC